MLSANSNRKQDWNGAYHGVQPWRSGGISEEEIELLRQVKVMVNRQYLPWLGEVTLGERERLTFEIDTSECPEPLDIYSITLELERDEVSQGIPVEWNVVRAHFKVSTREWQQRMQEEQYAGDCSVTLLYRGLPVPGFTSNIQLQVTRLAEQHYEYMRDILKLQNEKVLYSHRGRTHEISVLAGMRSAAAARYDIVVAYYERLMKVLPDIIDQPHRELRREITPVPANTVRALNFNSLRLAARSGSQWIVQPDDKRAAEAVISAEAELLEKAKQAEAAPLNSLQAQLLKAQRKLEKGRPPSKRRHVPAGVRVLPQRVPLPRLEESFDTYENRFLKMTLKKLVALSRLVEQQLQQEIQTAKREQNRSSRTRALALAARIKTNEEYTRHLERMLLRLEEVLLTKFLAEVGPLGPRRASVVLRENRYYRQIRQIERDIDDEVDLVSSTVSLEQANRSVRLSSVNQLYEYWVTVVVLQTMVEKLGFTVVAKEGKPVNTIATKGRFNYILQSGSSMELISPLGKRVLVYYDREYQSYQGFRNSPDYYSSENDFEQESNNEFGLNPIYYGYYAPVSMGSTKRRPDIAIEVFAESERVPKIIVMDATYSRDRRTLYAKYEYRDSIRDFTKTDAQSGTLARPVVAAWAVYPDDPTRLEHDEFRYGQLPLQPSPRATELLTTILRQLLHIAGALE
ncbi:MAG TPA: DUF2357 domain-containing protein [Chloroflexia bacterium]|nr:DUF2357 domain-containing protein [Chloroflexia bacterium]